jgi:hypothetical protein
VIPDDTNTFSLKPRRYAAFVSYRHADNKEPGRQWASWLHQALETYEIPADLVGSQNQRGELIPASLYPVFRDEEELPADADLTRNIRLALENSEILVVLCSPRSTGSRFVGDEIRYFKELGKSDRILALLIDGEPNASDDSGKQAAGISAEAECLPQPLRFGLPQENGRIDWTVRTEPIAADVRPNGLPQQGWTSSGAYRHQLERGGADRATIEREVRTYEERLELAKLKIIAGALAIPLGTLTQRDKAMQLRRARDRAKVISRWLTAVGILAILALTGGFYSLQKQRAVTETLHQLQAERAKETDTVTNFLITEGYAAPPRNIDVPVNEENYTFKVLLPVTKGLSYAYHIFPEGSADLKPDCRIYDETGNLISDSQFAGLQWSFLTATYTGALELFIHSDAGKGVIHVTCFRRGPAGSQN